jgi:hypothetical protein
MAILTGEKETLGEQFPRGTVDTSWGRTEPLITADKLVNRWLWGIPLVSRFKNPFTGKADVMTPDMLSDLITRAVGQVEALTHAELMPTQCVEKHPLDREEFRSQGYLRLQHRPVAAVQSVQLVASNDTVLFDFGNEWIDVGQLHQGQLNVLPLLLMLKNSGNGPGGSGTTAIAGSAQSAAYLSVFGGNQRWVASLIQIRYTCGFKDGLLPTLVNDAIGCAAAIMVLGALAPTFGTAQSASLSIDGLSQSQSTAGPMIFDTRIKLLQGMLEQFCKKIKSYLGLTLFSGNV